jgi:hypothetical protein
MNRLRRTIHGVRFTISVTEGYERVALGIARDVLKDAEEYMRKFPERGLSASQFGRSLSMDGWHPYSVHVTGGTDATRENWETAIARLRLALLAARDVTSLQSLLDGEQT